MYLNFGQTTKKNGQTTDEFYKKKIQNGQTTDEFYKKKIQMDKL